MGKLYHRQVAYFCSAAMVLFGLLFLSSCNRLSWKQHYHMVVLLPENGKPHGDYRERTREQTWKQEAKLFRKLAKDLLPDSFSYYVGSQFPIVDDSPNSQFLDNLRPWLFPYENRRSVIVWGANPLEPIPEPVLQQLEELQHLGAFLISYRYRGVGLQPDLVVEPAYEELGKKQATFLKQLPFPSPLVLLSENSDIPEVLRSYEAMRAELLEPLIQQSRPLLGSFPIVLDTEWHNEAELQNIFKGLPAYLRGLQISWQGSREKGLGAEQALGIRCSALSCGQAAVSLAQQYLKPIAFSVVANTSEGPQKLGRSLLNREDMQVQVLAIDSRKMVRTVIRLVINYLEQHSFEKNKEIVSLAPSVFANLPSGARLFPDADVPHVQVEAAEWVSGTAGWPASIQ